MKKRYCKPMLYAESFSLVEHIASCKTANQNSGVAITATYQSPTNCSYSDSGFTLFNAGVSGCPDSYDSESFSSVNEYIELMGLNTECYNAFIDGSFFAS